MEYFLDPDIFENDVDYFFSLHGPRFEYMNQAMAESLAKKYHKEFRPIRIFNAWPGNRYNKSNFILLNKRGYKLAKELGKPVIFLPDYEDVNQEFAESKFILKLADKLLKKQKTIFVYPFTASFLNLPSKKFTVLGPKPKFATKYDSKAEQLMLFRKLNLPHNKAVIYKNEDSLLANKEKVVPCYISAAFTSGGNESGLIYSQEMLGEFLAKVRNINKHSPFVVSEIFKDLTLAPNVNAVVTTTGEVYILVLSDQILNGNRYLGNIYPTAIGSDHRTQIYKITKDIGTYLAQEGYRGLFGLDFLINKNGHLVVVDLNPRHQGGYVCNHLALAKKDVSLTDLELAIFHNESVILSQKMLDEQLNFAWSHSKIIPPEKGQVIKGEFEHNAIEDPFIKIGEYFASEFYKKGSIFIEGYVGYQVQTAFSRKNIEQQMLHNQDKYLLPFLR